MTTCSKSIIPKIEVPEFKPSIPDYMVDSIEDNGLKFLVEQVSIIKQQNRWQSERIGDVYDYTRTINGKVIELEEYRQSQDIQSQIAEKLKEKTQKNRKFIWPVFLMTGILLYPLYISLFLEVGPGNIADFVAKFIP